MTGSAASGHMRSYDRNLAWCRFWLTIGIAVATLSFTFMAEQGFRPIIDPSSAKGEETQPTFDTAATDEDNGMPKAASAEQVNWFDISIFASLILTSGSCILASYRFRLLYMKDDLSIKELIPGDHQEAIP